MSSVRGISAESDLQNMNVTEFNTVLHTKCRKYVRIKTNCASEAGRNWRTGSSTIEKIYKNEPFCRGSGFGKNIHRIVSDQKADSARERVCKVMSSPFDRFKLCRHFCGLADSGASAPIARLMAATIGFRLDSS